MRDVDTDVRPGAPSATLENGQRRANAAGGNLRADRGVKALGLCMIVKNESKVILRCLESVRPIVDYVLVEDTGSTDGTQNLVREWLERAGLPGEVYDEPWRDFAYNRSHALARLREQNNIDYAFILDADDELVLDPGFDIIAFKRSLSHDLYDVELWTGASLRRYRRAQICSNRREFLYRGVLHEFIDTAERALSWGPGKVKFGNARGFHISSTRQGARNEDPDKYRKDAQLLEKALSEEKDKFLRSRYTFYLARSYRDAGEKEKAIAYFLKRAELGFWADEIYISLFSAGQLQQEIGKLDEALASFQRAYQTAPRRAEALHAASRLCRESKRFAEGYEYARRGLAIPLPSGGLFVEPWRYEYGLLDELAVNAFWSGKYQESLDACQRLLREGKMPQQMHDRIKKNAQFAADKLSKGAAAGVRQPTIMPVFIHAAPRTSSTWFWLKFRELPSTLCFYEPFNHSLNWMTRERAAKLGRDSWDSRHPQSDPYYREYTALLREGGGVKHFVPAMTMQWFLPEGGLHGKLRPSETDYLSLMIESAREAGKTPVLGDCWSLGRVWAIKQAYGGFHIFQYRNLWQQWLSYLSYKRQDDLTFYNTTVDIIWRDDDPYFQYLAAHGLKHAAEPWSGAGPKPSPLRWKRMYENIARDADKVRALEVLPEHHAFALFMGLQIYLYLHAQLCADLQADVTRMARDERYRANIETQIKQRAGLTVSFADAADVPPQTAVDFDQASVDWDEIREYGRVAAEMLSKYGDPTSLAANAKVLIDETIEEMRRAEKQRDLGEKKMLSQIHDALESDLTAQKSLQEMLANPEDPKAAAAAGAKILTTQKSATPRIFGCFGLHSSGSTWMFNLVREICQAQKIEFASLHRDMDENLPWNLLGKKLIVVKTHNPSASFQSLIARCGEPAVITVREPRDAVASLMQRFSNTLGKNFNDALNALDYSARTLTALAKARAIPVFRYEDGFVGSLETFDRIAALLGTAPAKEVCEEILARLSPAAVKTAINALEAAGAIRGEEAWDHETHWHAKHVGDGKVGKYEAILTLAQQREVLERTREFCEQFGYSATADKATNAAPAAAVQPADVPPSIEAPTLVPADPKDAKHGKTIGLCMIVKNETKLIRRCLESVLPLLDYILVVDTGSTDGTQQMIRDFLAEKKIAGAVIDEPWRDFAWNRSFAMAKLREVESVDYAMVIDADDTLEIDAGFDPAAFKAALTADYYDVPVRHGSIAHYRPQLFSNRLPFLFKGVLHEYLEAPPGELKRETLSGFAVRASTGGARSANPRKYQDDAAVLEQALTTETNPFLISRYTFYLAQSYRDCGEREKALENYLKRVELGHWVEEIYVSLFEAGNLMAALDRPFDDVIATWERASKLVPGRAEALHAASRYCRDKGKNAQGMEIARRGIELKQPGGLFIQPWVYDYGLLDEFSINAYWAGAYHDSLDSALKLLASDKLPASMVKRIAANARFAGDKIPGAKAPNLGKVGDETYVQQHALVPQRPLHSRVKGTPRILLAILAKQKEPALPLYLECIEALDYPKSSIVLYIRTNNNTDKTEQILRDWVARVGHLYHSVEFDASNVAEKVEQFREHEWNATRFSVLGRIRNQSMRRAIELECDYYFVPDVDNFIRPATLRELVALDLPIASPLLRSIAPAGYYSNFHAEIDDNGYYRNCDQYYWILNRYVRGVVEVPVVHCTYLVRTDVIPQLTYEDATGRYEYVVFSHSARKAGIPQYFDNRQIYGYITFGEGDDHHVAGGIDQARALLKATGDEAILTKPPAVAAPSVVPAAVPLPDLPIHLINLDRSTERLASFQKYNAHLRNVIRVSAVDGRQLDKEKLIKDGLVTSDCAYGAGALACALSHVNLWNKAVAENTVMTVFEDDAIATDRFEEKAARFMAGLPKDWDFIQWGYNFNPLFVWADFGFSKATLRFYSQQFQGDDKSRFQSTNLVPSPVKLAHSYGTVAYSVSPKGAALFLKHCLPLRKQFIPFPGTGIVNSNEGIDCTMNIVYNAMQAFISIPPLVLEDKVLASDRVSLDTANAK